MTHVATLTIFFDVNPGDDKKSAEPARRRNGYDCTPVCDTSQEPPMREIEINERARQLLDTYGPQAIVEAARKAVTLEAKGETEEATAWRHIEAAMKLMRGPHQS
jgi:hypothetical protein